MKTKINQQIWIPRAINLAILLFLSIFAFDVFDSKVGVLKVILAFLIHLLPSILLLVVFLISFKIKWLAGLMMIGLGIFFTFYFSTYKSIINFAIISLPILITGFLYLLVKDK